MNPLPGMRGTATAAILCLTVVGCGPAAALEPPPDPAAEADQAREQITAWIANFERWLAAGQVDSISTLVTDDYAALAPNQVALAGREQFAAYMRQAVALGQWTEQHQPETLEVQGSLAVQRGRFTLGFVPSPSAPKGTLAVNDTGKFLWHWRRENGRWLLAAAAWSSDLPAKP